MNEELLVEETKNYWSGKVQSGQEWTVHNGDVIDVLSKLGDESFNCCVTSPPYYWLRDYGNDKQIGKEETVEDYVKAINNVMSEVQKKLKTDGLLFLNLGDTYYSGRGESKGKDTKSKKRRFGLRAVDKSGGLGIGLQKKSAIGIPWRVAIEMMQNDWVLRSTIIWHRENCLREYVTDRPSRSYEYIFMFSKSRKYFFDKKLLITEKFDQDVWAIATNGKSEIDTAPYPDELVRRCLSIGCRENGKVLDPFAGSGTTLRVAIDKGFSATGIEINPEFCKYMVNQLNTLA
ncbi:MAG: DNA-methyltransferase [Pyrinomonadaceae bacterium]